MNIKIRNLQLDFGYTILGVKVTAAWETSGRFLFSYRSAARLGAFKQMAHAVVGMGKGKLADERF